MQVELRADRDIDQLHVVLAAEFVQQCEVDVGLDRVLCRIEHRHAMQARDLGLGVHLRGTGTVLHRLPGQYGANLLRQRVDLLVIGPSRLDDGNIEFLGERERLVCAKPRFERQAAFGCKVGSRCVFAHDLG